MTHERAQEISRQQLGDLISELQGVILETRRYAVAVRSMVEGFRDRENVARDEEFDAMEQVARAAVEGIDQIKARWHEAYTLSQGAFRP